MIKSALTASFVSGLAPEALTTIAPQPWPEIIRVSRSHGCESLMLGLSDLDQPKALTQLENLMGRVWFPRDRPEGTTGMELVLR